MTSPARRAAVEDKINGTLVQDFAVGSRANVTRPNQQNDRMAANGNL